MNRGKNLTQNSGASTGPKSAHGKSTSSKNAIKTGLLAKQMVSNSAVDPGSIADFKNLVDELNRTYKPEGIEEQLQVELVATKWWRLARLWRYEVGETTRPLLPGNLAALNGRDVPFDVLTEPDSAIHRLNMELQTLYLVRKEVSETGVAQKTTLNLLAELEGTNERLLLALLSKRLLFRWHLRKPEPPSPAVEASIRLQKIAEPNPAGGDRKGQHSSADAWPSEVTPERQVQLFLQQIDSLIQPRLYWKEIAAEAAKVKAAGGTSRAILPDEPSSERILRYGSITEKQLYRALEELRCMIALRVKRESGAVPR